MAICDHQLDSPFYLCYSDQVSLSNIKLNPNREWFLLQVAKAMPKIDRRKRKSAAAAADESEGPSVKKTKVIPMEVSSKLSAYVVHCIIFMVIAFWVKTQGQETS